MTTGEEIAQSMMNTKWKVRFVHILIELIRWRFYFDGVEVVQCVHIDRVEVVHILMDWGL